jgi:hypothetical protein
MEKYWGNGSGLDVCVDASGAVSAGPCALPADSGYTLMEYNFALFFGLAVQAYEATLIPDQTPVDIFNNPDPAERLRLSLADPLLFNLSYAQLGGDWRGCGERTIW